MTKNNAMIYRQGNINDLQQLKQLALISWQKFKAKLTTENWQKLFDNLNNDAMYINLLEKSYCLVCENADKEIIGMTFLVPKGNPTEIYDAKWSYIRLLSVNPDFGGQGIGRQLTERCIEYAKNHNEQTIPLHTSEIMDNARRIYEAAGFKILKEIEPRLGKKYWLYTLDIA